MKLRTMVILSHDEVNEQIPYSMICMTRYGATWGTGRRRRRWLNEFTESEREACSKLFKLSHTWTCVKGVPDEVKMSTNTFVLWRKLGDFCASL